MATVAIQALRSAHYDTSDHVIFYFAGHGVTHEGQDCLICSDTKKDYKDVVTTAEVFSCLRQSGAGMTTLILDACRVQVERSGNNIFGEQTAELARRFGVVSFFGCSPNEVCQELSELQTSHSPFPGHGVFTHAFIETISHSSERTPFAINQNVIQKVGETCTKYNLGGQIPYTVVMPLEKAFLDLITREIRMPRPPHRPICMLIIGPSNAGKTTLGRVLATELKYLHAEMSSFAWRRYVLAQEKDGYQGSLQDFVEDLWRSFGKDILAKDLLAEHEGATSMVLCGARRPEEIETITGSGWEIIPIYIFANEWIRFLRYIGSMHARYDRYAEFVKRDLRELDWGLAKIGTMREFTMVINERKIDECQDYCREIVKQKMQ